LAFASARGKNLSYAARNSVAGCNRELDVAVQQIVFQAGGHSGWHSHPGPVIQVVSGTMTFYESDDPNCTPVVGALAKGSSMWASTHTSRATRAGVRRRTS